MFLLPLPRSTNMSNHVWLDTTTLLKNWKRTEEGSVPFYKKYQFHKANVNEFILNFVGIRPQQNNRITNSYLLTDLNFN